MNSNQINCFLEVAKEKNFTNAAANLYMNQPNLSRTIATLESELETRLFIRHPDKSIELSAQGKMYYDFFRDSLNAFNEIKNRCHIYENNDIEIRIGYISEWDMSDYLADKIINLNQKHPEIIISLVPMLIDELEPALRAKSIDALITLKQSIATDSEFAIKTIYHLPKVIIFKNSMFESNPSQLSLLDFHDKTFYLYPEAMLPSMLRYLHRHLAPYKPIVKTSSSVEKVISEIEYGKGVAIMDEWCRVSFSRRISAYSLNDHHNVVFVYRKGGNVEALDAIRKAFTDL